MYFYDFMKLIVINFIKFNMLFNIIILIYYNFNSSKQSVWDE